MSSMQTAVWWSAVWVWMMVVSEVVLREHWRGGLQPTGQVGTRQDREYHATTASKRDVRKEAASNTPTAIHLPGAIWAMFCHKLGQQ